MGVASGGNLPIPLNVLTQFEHTINHDLVHSIDG
jgi:hypothetical protein